MICVTVAHVVQEGQDLRDCCIAGVLLWLVVQVMLGGGPEDIPPREPPVDSEDDCIVLASPAPTRRVCPVFTSPAQSPPPGPLPPLSFASPSRSPAFAPVVSQLMASPAMRKFVGQQAHTAESQAFATECVTTMVVTCASLGQFQEGQAPGQLSANPGNTPENTTQEAAPEPASAWAKVVV